MTKRRELSFNGVKVPAGEILKFEDNRPLPSNRPIITYIEGDGIGAEISEPVRRILDEAVRREHKGEKQIVWYEVYAGDKAMEKFGKALPKDTIRAIKKFGVALKGPLATPTGGGMRSLNVALRKKLDLYQCVRPVRWYKGVPSPVKRPQDLDIVIFRQNDEDVYAGIEMEAGSKKAKRMRKVLKKMGWNIRKNSGIGIKPISEFGSKRLVRQAIKYAIEHGRTGVTIVAKGNIQKFTEGAFLKWGKEVAAQEFGDKVITWDEVKSKYNGKLPADKVALKTIILDDRIADAMFCDLLAKASQFSVIATTNLNGDYLSDAAASQVGGLGIAPGANVGENCAVYEPTHGTAPDIAGQNKANPCSKLLSGVMMLDYLRWHGAAQRVVQAIEKTIEAKTLTGDLTRLMEGATTLSTTEFADAIIANMATD